VQLIGVPDPKSGAEICAWVKLKDGALATEDEIRAYCRALQAT
jgi:fatty-acyl-CoA synthase